MSSGNGFSDDRGRHQERQGVSLRGNGASAGVVGRRPLVRGSLGPDGRLLVRFDRARTEIDAVAARHLPRLREAIAARTMDDAQSATHRIRQAFGIIERELDGAEPLVKRNGADGDAARLIELEERFAELRLTAAPTLALAPPPAPAGSPSEPFLICHGPALHGRYAADDRDAELRWNSQLDAHDSTPSNVIDASHRFGRDRDETRAAAIQRRATGYPVDDMELPERAAAGVSGGAGRLPHLDVIQRSFGAHDVTGVESHVGGRAADAAASIGAEAYATGNHVAFAVEPSLFVAAHEAAHVVQQRAGVQLLGGVGRAGDAYEQHADAVAARVVAGESAEALLGDVTTGRAGAGVVQRQEKEGEAEGEEKALAVPSNKYVITIPIKRFHGSIAIEITRHHPAAYEKELGHAAAGDVEFAGKVEALQPKIETAVGQWGAKLGDTLLKGVPISAEFPGVEVEAEVEAFELEGDRHELELKLAAVKVKVKADVLDIARWMGASGAGWEQLEREASIKVVGTLDIPLPDSAFAHIVASRKVVEQLDRELEVLDEAERSAREAEDVARQFDEVAQERKAVMEALAESTDTGKRAALEARYRQLSAKLEARTTEMWEQKAAVEASKARFVDLESKLARHTTALEKRKFLRKLQEKLAKMMEGKVARYALRAMEVLGLIGTVLDLIDAYVIIRHPGDSKFGIGGADGPQEGRDSDAPALQDGDHQDVGTGVAPNHEGPMHDGSRGGRGGDGPGAGQGTADHGKRPTPGRGGTAGSDAKGGDGGSGREDQGGTKGRRSDERDGGARVAVSPAVHRLLAALGHPVLDDEALALLDELVPADLTPAETAALADRLSETVVDDPYELIGAVARTIRDLRTPDEEPTPEKTPRKHHGGHDSKKKSKDRRYQFDLAEAHDWFVVDERGELVPSPAFERWKEKHVGSLEETVGGASYVLGEAEAAASLRGDYWAAGVRLSFREKGGERVEEESFGFTVDPASGKTTGVIESQPNGPIEKIVQPPEKEGDLPTVRVGARADFGDYQLEVEDSSTPSLVPGTQDTYEITFTFVIKRAKKGHQGTLIGDDLRQIPIENGRQLVKTLEVQPRGGR